MALFYEEQEGALIDRVQQSRKEQVASIIINPAGFTHTSVALRDALAGVAIPFIEVHLSNIHAREPFRRHSYFSDQAAGTICGLGSHGYELALQFVLQHARGPSIPRIPACGLAPRSKEEQPWICAN